MAERYSGRGILVSNGYDDASQLQESSKSVENAAKATIKFLDAVWGWCSATD